MEAGNPTLTALAAVTGVSKSVISDAFSGERLPTENTTSQLAKALGADPGEWLARRRSLDRRFGAPAGAGDGATSVGGGRTVRLRTAIATTGAGVLVGAAISSAVWAIAGSAMPPVAPNALPFDTGVDPMTTACRNDAVIAAYEERNGGDYVVEMLYSHNCMAAWGRVTRYDERAAGNELGMTVYPIDDIGSDRTQERESADLHSLYTPMLIEPDVEARVCGVAWVTVDGEKIDLSPALCI